jgi:hypothetical protein
MTMRGADPAGNPVGLIGQPLVPGRGSVPSLIIITEEDTHMAKLRKADSNGHYTLNGARFRVRQGDVIPEGAEFASGEFFSTNEESRVVRRAAPDEERAEQQAPENKSRKAAPETKAK